jgi:ribulose-phosphate 3-epimerase
MYVTPAILPKSFEELQDKLELLQGVQGHVQVDLCDGIIGKEHTWMPIEGSRLPEGFEYEIDLMVKDWKTPLHILVEAGVKRFVMHMDSFSPVDTIDLLSIAKDKGLEIGISVSNDKDVHVHKSLVQGFQEKWRNVFIQVMGIATIGIQGQPLDKTVPERIAFLKQVFPTIPLQVDGGMNNLTIPLVVMKGADGAVVGSYLFKNNDPKEALKELTGAAK